MVPRMMSCDDWRVCLLSMMQVHLIEDSCMTWLPWPGGEEDDFQVLALTTCSAGLAPCLDCIEAFLVALELICRSEYAYDCSASELLAAAFSAVVCDALAQSRYARVARLARLAWSCTFCPSQLRWDQALPKHCSQAAHCSEIRSDSCSRLIMKPRPDGRPNRRFLVRQKS